jgi:ABC-type sugar transport system ATPase subunit
MSAPLLLTRGIGQRFGVVQALSDVTLPVFSGEVLALVGENGAGKSTLLRILEGAQQPLSGALLMQGIAVAFRSPADAHACGIRVVHQEPDIFGDLSVAENLFAGDLSRRAGILFDRAAMARRTREALLPFGLAREIFAWTRAGSLGPAHRQLLEIVRALRAGVKILALDEPTSSLTEAETARLFDVLRRLRASGVALLYVSHRMHEVRKLADRIAVLRDGKLVAHAPAAAMDDATVVQSMVGRPLSTLFEQREKPPGAVVLEVRGLTTARVRDCTLSVREGEVVGLAGLIGAGRSELAMAIFGHDPLHAGTVSVAGRPVRLRSPADAIAAGIGLAPEERKSQALLLLRSVADNLTLCVPDRISRLGFVRHGIVRKIAGEQVARLRVRTPGLEQLVAKLSGGNQQKIVLGRWLARRPRVLILDEPTRGIDVGAKAEIYRLIAGLAADGMAVLVVSSEMPELLGLCDRILVMAGGRITGELPRAQASEAAILALAMQQPVAMAA